MFATDTNLAHNNRTIASTSVRFRILLLRFKEFNLFPDQACGQTKARKELVSTVFVMLSEQSVNETYIDMATNRPCHKT